MPDDDLKAQLGEDALVPAASKGADLKTIVVEEKCETCDGPMIVRRGKRGFFLGCAKYPKCKGTREPGPLTMEKITAVTGP